MALQGTLDTFALADLVRLLATTEKTGELAIDGDRGRGRLWFADGDLVGGEPAPSGDVVDALFALLRMADGDFVFEADRVPAEPVPARRALEALGTAEERLEAWRPVEALVPTLAVRLALREELADDEVVVDRATWRALVAVASSSTAADLAVALDLDEVTTAYAVRDLVDAGLITVSEPAVAEPTVAVAVAPVDDDTAPVEDVFVPVELEDVPLPGEAEALAVREARASEAAAETAAVEQAALEQAALEQAALEQETAELDPADVTPDADAAPWTAIEPQPTIASAAELLTSGGPLADDLAAIDEGALGNWEPLPTPAAEALPDLDAPSVEAPATLDAALPPVPGSLAVDLDAQLGGMATDHSYLDQAAGADTLPEPLLAAPSDAAIDDSVARADREPWPPTSDGLTADDLPLDALSPAAAAAVAAASEASGTEVEAGRRVLRRIISTGKG